MKMILVTFLVSTLAITLVSFDQTFDLKASIARGEKIYTTQCASCHMAEGEGIAEVFPPLAKSEYLNDKNRLIKVVLQGVRGPMKINGIEYNSEMPGVKLTDQQVSDVLNFIRNSWGNKAAPILPAEIKAGLKAPSKNYTKY
mgnify:FL=1